MWQKTGAKIWGWNSIYIKPTLRSKKNCELCSLDSGTDRCKIGEGKPGGHQWNPAPLLVGTYWPWPCVTMSLLLLEGVLKIILGHLISYTFLDSSCVHRSSGYYQEDVIEKPSTPQHGIVRRGEFRELIYVNTVVISALLTFSSLSSWRGTRAHHLPVSSEIVLPSSKKILLQNISILGDSNFQTVVEKPAMKTAFQIKLSGQEKEPFSHSHPCSVLPEGGVQNPFRGQHPSLSFLTSLWSHRRKTTYQHVFLGLVPTSW